MLYIKQVIFSFLFQVERDAKRMRRREYDKDTKIVKEEEQVG
jgi:hypothetical protein